MSVNGFAANAPCKSNVRRTGTSGAVKATCVDAVKSAMNNARICEISVTSIMPSFPLAKTLSEALSRESRSTHASGKSRIYLLIFALFPPFVYSSM